MLTRRRCLIEFFTMYYARTEIKYVLRRSKRKPTCNNNIIIVLCTSSSFVSLFPFNHVRAIIQSQLSFEFDMSEEKYRSRKRANSSRRCRVLDRFCRCKIIVDNILHLCMVFTHLVTELQTS